MNDAPPAARRLAWLLRIEAITLLTALVAVVMPLDTMARIHAELGMGELPREPLVEYLTRSISGLYAMWGPVFWYLSRDVVRHQALIRLLAVTKLFFGLFLLTLDLRVGLPTIWVSSEGPIVIVLSIVTLIWLRALKPK